MLSIKKSQQKSIKIKVNFMNKGKNILKIVLYLIIILVVGYCIYTAKQLEI